LQQISQSVPPPEKPSPYTARKKIKTQKLKNKLKKETEKTPTRSRNIHVKTLQKLVTLALLLNNKSPPRQNPRKKKQPLAEQERRRRQKKK
jgi:hypothetical protein